MQLDPIMPVLIASMFDIEPAHVVTRREAGAVHREIDLHGFEWQARLGNQMVQVRRQGFQIKIFEDGVVVYWQERKPRC